MFSSRIEILKKKIQDYILSGGDIYKGRRELPYYKYMSRLKKDMEEQYGVSLTMEYMYALCGIKFDREYNHYKVVCEKLASVADENGCIDIIRTNAIAKEENVYNELKEMARKSGSSLLDYVYFMTPFHFSVGRVQGDSIRKLKKDLLKVYPTRDITGIRWDYPDLYERIRSLQILMPERMSKQDLIQFLGFTNERFSTKLKDVKIDEDKVIQELNKLYPNKVISNITNLAPALYFDVAKLSFANDLTIQQWLKTKGFNYITGIASSRLSTTQISFKSRVAELEPLKTKHEKLILKYVTDDVDRYYKKLEVMKKSLAELDEIDQKFCDEHGL